MKRVMIIGQPGSGKSTLARAIGAKTGLPVYHMDRIHWMPGWQERLTPKKIALAMEVQNRDAWIFEGGLGATKQHRLERCDTLINLDLPYPRRMFRVLKRTFFGYGRTRPDLPEDCPEQVNLEFWKWIWNTRNRNRRANLDLMARAGPHVTVHHLRSPAEVRRFLSTL